MTLDQLQTVLEALANDQSLIAEARAYLGVPHQRKSFAELVMQGGSKQDFLALERMTDAIYTELRTKLNKKPVSTDGIIVAIRGQRGGLGLIPLVRAQEPPIDANEEQVREDAKKANESELKAERSYYPMVRQWAMSNGYPDCEITTGMPGYRWENPDLIALSFYASKLTKSLRFEVTSFEVKLGVEPYAVWQAAHYKRFSTEVYVVFAMSEDAVRTKQDGRVFELAVELGLGVLAFEKESRTLKLLQSPRIQAPDDVNVDEVVGNYTKPFETVIARAKSEHAKNWQFGPIV